MMSFFFEQIKMRYITKPSMLQPAQGVQKEEHPKIFTELWCTHQNRAPNKQHKKLHNNTHTRDGMLPPVVVSVIKSSLLRFQPKERLKFNFFNEHKRS